MKKISRSIRILVETNEDFGGFDIYLDFSGHREYLMTHRRNFLLYTLLKDGVPVADLMRWKPGNSCVKIRRDNAVMLSNSVRYLLVCVEDHIRERAA